MILAGDFLNMSSELVHYCYSPVLRGAATVDPGRHDARGRDGAYKVRITSVDRRGIRPVRPALAEDPYAAAQVVVEQLGRDGDGGPLGGPLLGPILDLDCHVDVVGGGRERLGPEDHKKSTWLGFLLQLDTGTYSSSVGTNSPEIRTRSQN